MALGAFIGGIVELGIQTVPQLVDGRSIQELSVDWARVAGSAAGGAVMGLTLGVGTAIGATSLGATAAVGAIDGGLGGQAGAYTEAAATTLIQGNDWNNEHVLAAARENGWGDWSKITIDAGAGAASAVVGHGLARLAQGVGLLPKPRAGIATPTLISQMDIHGKGYLVPDGGPLQIPMSNLEKSILAATVSSWSLLQSAMEELSQRSSEWFFGILNERLMN